MIAFRWVDAPYRTIDTIFPSHREGKSKLWGVNWSASFVNIVPTTVVLQPVFLSFWLSFIFSKVFFQTKFTCSDRSYHDEWFEHHVCMFDKHLTSFHSLLWNTDFQRLMDSSALEIYAQTNNDAHTGDEYMQKKQRTDASEVTNLWLMGISCSKDIIFRVWELHTFSRTLAKLPVWWAVWMTHDLPVVAPWSCQKF